MGHRRINGPSQSPPPLLTFPWHVPRLPSPQPLLRNPLHPVTYAPRRDPYNSIPVVLVPRYGIDTRRGVVSTCLRFSSIDLASLLSGTSSFAIISVALVLFVAVVFREQCFFFF